jgi:hypothetical protein
MNIENLNKIREAISFFEDIEFETLVNENTLLVKSKVDKSVWSIGYSLEGEFKLLGESAILVSEGEKPEVPKTIKDLAKNLFNKTNTIEEMKNQLLEVDFKPTVVAENKFVVEAEQEEESSLFETLTEEEQTSVETFVTKYKHYIEKEKETVNSFIKEVAFVFENGQVRAKTFLSPKKILDIYSQKTKIRSSIEEGAKTFKNFSNKIESFLEEKEINSKFADVILEGFEVGKDMTVQWTKNLLKLKKEHRVDLNISETTKVLKTFQKEVFEGFEPSTISNSISAFNEGVISDYGGGTAFDPKVERFSFLRFGANMWSKEAVRALLEDFNAVMARFNSLSMEELQKVSLQKDIVEYMFRTGNIDDEIVTGIINDFNKAFGPGSKRQEMAA